MCTCHLWMVPHSKLIIIYKVSSCYRGTKEFVVSVSTAKDGPWTEFKSGTLEDPRPFCAASPPSDKNPVLEFDANQVTTARYVKFQCVTFYGARCALSFIEVY